MQRSRLANAVLVCRIAKDITVVILLVSLVFSGCGAGRRIYFTSDPPGASVAAGDVKCKTPCMAEISNKVSTASVSFSPNFKRQVVLNSLENQVPSSMPANSVDRAAASTFGFLSGTFATVSAVIGLGLYSVLPESGEEWGNQETKLFLVGTAALLGGVAVTSFFDYLREQSLLSKNELVPHAEVVFDDLLAIREEARKSFSQENPSDKVISVQFAEIAQDRVRLNITYLMQINSNLALNRNDIWIYRYDASGHWVIEDKCRSLL